MRIRSVPPSFAPTLVASCLFLMVAGCGSADGPAEGYWGGAHLSFQVKDGAVLDLRPSSISCNGEDGCYAEFIFVDPSVSYPIVGGSFSGALESTGGTHALDGHFDTNFTASGTHHFVASSGCCTVSGHWKAEFLKPYDPPVVEEDVADDAGGGDVSPPADVGVLPSDYPPSATEAQIVAVHYANELRQALDLPLLVEVEPINFAAQAHAEYFELHCSKYLESNLSPHNENAAWKEGFSGNGFDDRMVKYGFEGYPAWEVMAFNGNAIAAIDGWVATLYHRIPFVHPDAFEMGFGTTTGGCYNWSGGTDVMDFSRHSVSVDHAVAYPYDGQTDVVPGWGGYESPQPPMAPGQAYPSGPIITLTVPSGGGSLSISEHLLLDDEGNLVPHMYVDPSTDPAGFLSQTVALYAHQPLFGFTQYTVRLTGKWKNQDQVWEWRFTTGADQEQYW